MPSTTPPVFLKLLAHDLRWHLVQALTAGDYRVAELVDYVAQPMNLVSYHLKQLRAEGVVATRRSEADGRDVYYSLDLNRVRDLYVAAGAALHPALTQPAPLPTHQRVLFVCTHNSARSQMAEGLFRALGGDATSAGSEPTTIHPDALTTMAERGIDIGGQHSKSVADLAGQTFDTVITVCDRARETCPTFPGATRYLHWGYPDPVLITDPAERRLAFANIATHLHNRITYFLSNPVAM